MSEIDRGGGWGGRNNKGGVIINLSMTGGNTRMEWTMGTAMYVLMGPRDGFGVVLRVGASLGHNYRMTVGTTLGVSMGPSNNVG